MDLLRAALLVAFKMAAPMLVISIVIGLIVAIFQAATQIHEQTLTFVPKVVAIALLLMVTGPWMITLMRDFTAQLFVIMRNINM